MPLVIIHINQRCEHDALVIIHINQRCEHDALVIIHINQWCEHDATVPRPPRGGRRAGLPLAERVAAPGAAAPRRRPRVGARCRRRGGDWARSRSRVASTLHPPDSLTYPVPLYIRLKRQYDRTLGGDAAAAVGRADGRRVARAPLRAVVSRRAPCE
jgi:hypothetical protein